MSWTTISLSGKDYKNRGQDHLGLQVRVSLGSIVLVKVMALTGLKEEQTSAAGKG